MPGVRSDSSQNGNPISDLFTSTAVMLHELLHTNSLPTNSEGVLSTDLVRSMVYAQCLFQTG